MCSCGGSGWVEEPARLLFEHRSQWHLTLFISLIPGLHQQRVSECLVSFQGVFFLLSEVKIERFVCGYSPGGGGVQNSEEGEGTR